MDPLGGFITLWLVFMLLKRAAERTDVINERLAASGIDPVDTGHPLRDRIANAWRAAWADLHNRASARATATRYKASSSPGWWARWRQRSAERAARIATERLTPWVRYDLDTHSDRIREEAERVVEQHRPPQDTEDDASSGPESTTIHSDVGGQTTADDATTSATPPPTQDDASDREPIRVNATVGALPPPAPTTAIEGGTTMGNAVATTDVTGVVSGQQAAMAIANGIAHVTEAYRVAIQAYIRKAQNLGEQAMSAQVGFAPNSTVIVRLSEACEILAVENARAARAQAEIRPMFVFVAAEFAKRNS